MYLFGLGFEVNDTEQLNYIPGWPGGVQGSISTASKKNGNYGIELLGTAAVHDCIGAEMTSDTFWVSLWLRPGTLGGIQTRWPIHVSNAGFAGSRYPCLGLEDDGTYMTRAVLKKHTQSDTVAASGAEIGAYSFPANHLPQYHYYQIETTIKSTGVAYSPTVTLASNIDASTTSVPYTSTGDPILDGHCIIIDSERMIVTSVNTSTNTLTVQRGCYRSTAAPHTATAAITQLVVDMKLYIDGTQQISVTDVTEVAESLSAKINLSGALSSGKGTLKTYFDDIFINDSAGSSYNSLPPYSGGSTYVFQGAQPFNDVTGFNDFTSSVGGKKYADVDDFNDTTDPADDYVSSSTLGHQQMFCLKDMASGETPLLVNLWAVGRSGYAIPGKYMAHVNNEARATGDWTIASATGSNHYSIKTLLTTPGGATWDEAKFNSLQAGFKASNVGTENRVYVFGAEIMGQGITKPAATTSGENANADCAANSEGTPFTDLTLPPPVPLPLGVVGY